MIRTRTGTNLERRHVEAALLERQRVAPGPGPDVQHPAPTHPERGALQLGKLVRRSEEVTHRVFVEVPEIVVHPDHDLCPAEVIRQHRVAVGLPGLEIHCARPPHAICPGSG